MRDPDSTKPSHHIRLQNEKTNYFRFEVQRLFELRISDMEQLTTRVDVFDGAMRSRTSFQNLRDVTADYCASLHHWRYQ